MIDIHSHILPGLDDGARSWKTAIAMARMAHDHGTTHIVATPHANDRYRYDRGYALELLARLSNDCGVALNFSIGCDFHFSIENVEAALLQPHHYTIGSTDYLLIEFSDFGISPFTGDAILRILSRGITPIITHPERNPVFQHKPESVLQFVENGCLVQVTANSITGFWGDRAQKTARFLLDNNCVHVIASDAHDTTRRPPLLSDAHKYLSKHYSTELADRLCTLNPRAIVENRPL
ncbi:MAG: tyrosine protein phosphatase [Acidobacteriaceae bacterium]